MSKSKRVAIYTRVSTANQNDRMQLRELRHFADRRDFEVVTVARDVASGAREKRPGLDEVMELARRRKIDAVLVWKLDRFARSTSHLLRALEELSEYGVGFISYDDPGMDTTTPQGKLLFTIMGAVAEMERSQTIERVKAGMARARAEGIHVGRPTLDLDVLADMRARRKQGESMRDIADELGVSVGAVAKYTAVSSQRRSR